MNREEAIQKAEKALKDPIAKGGGVALLELDYLRGLLEALTAPTAPQWVKTSDRLPTKADAGVDEEIVTIYDDGETRIMGTDYWAFVATVPERFPYWLPVPKLPEVDDD